MTYIILFKLYKIKYIQYLDKKLILTISAHMKYTNKKKIIIFFYKAVII